MNKQRRDRIDTLKESLAGLKSELETIQEEEQEAYDAMPEGSCRAANAARRPRPPPMP